MNPLDGWRALCRAMWCLGRAASERTIDEVEPGTVVELENGRLARVEWRLAGGAAMCRRWSSAGLPLTGGICSHLYLPGHALVRVVTP